jgi:hypothetical protein
VKVSGTQAKTITLDILRKYHLLPSYLKSKAWQVIIGIDRIFSKELNISCRSSRYFIIVPVSHTCSASAAPQKMKMG